MRERIQKLSITNILMLTYIGILSILLLIGTILYHISYNRVKNGINEQNRLTVSSSIQSLDNTTQVIAAAARQVSSNFSFGSIADMTGRENSRFYYSGYQTQQSLKSFSPVDRMLPVSSSFIYMSKSHYALSSILFSEFDFYVRNNLTLNMTGDQVADILMDSGNWNRFLSMDDMMGTYNGNYLYVYPLSPSVPAAERVHSVLCYEFDRQQLSQYFSDIHLFEIGYLAVYNKNNELIFLNAGPDAVLYDRAVLADLSYEDQIATFTPASSRDTLLVTTGVSPYSGWTYYLVQPRDQAYYSITTFQRLFIFLLILAMMIGIAIAVFGSIVNRRQLQVLSSRLTAQESLVTSLNQQVEEQTPVVEESYLRKIMEGTAASLNDIHTMVDTLNLEKLGVKDHVLFTEVSPADDKQIRPEDIEQRIRSYDTLVRDALKRYFPNPGYLYKPSSRTFAILIASDERVPYDQVAQQNRETFTVLHQELLNQYGIWICGGIGGRNGVASYMWKSYQQAREAKAVTTPNKYFMSISDFANSTDVYFYPESLAVQLNGFISTGNREQVSELFKLIYYENTVRRNLPYTQSQWLISDIRSTLFKKRHILAEEELDSSRRKTLDLIDRQFNGEMSLEVLKAIALELCDVYGTDTDSNDLIVKIQEYINNNYHDPELGLTKISSEFGISENYFSYLFKKEVAENFSTYLERLRMAKAKEMVLETDTSLSTLYQYVGYNNAASFRRAFKRNFDVSPKEMRESVK